MTLAPLLSASPAIQLHAFAAMATFALGIVQFASHKGSLPHRTVGWIWAALMFTVAISAFWIHELRVWGPWSPIHLLAIVTLISLPLGLWYAHTHNVRGHKATMISMFFGALIIAGLFTFVPGRIMYDVLFGG